MLWDYSCHVKDNWDGECMIMGDFNEVRTEEERFWSLFNRQGANAFNNFITSACLVGLSLGSYSFTWAHKSATKMSKLDSFLISEGLLAIFPHLFAICLDRHLSDHRPILLKEMYSDFSAIPFRIFHSWFQRDGFNKMVEGTWKNLDVTDNNRLIYLNKKWKLLKQEIRSWIKKEKSSSSMDKAHTQNKLTDIDRMLNPGCVNIEILNQRTELMKSLNDINSLETMKAAQKAIVRWAIEGDENTKYYNGIVGNK
nr:RNA-directed DNA polymerase, eukaryota [Tanacetum cinerariifolium]